MMEDFVDNNGRFTPDETKTTAPSPSPDYKKIGGFILLNMTAYAAMRAGNIRMALLSYPKIGGGGLNIYKVQANGKYHRFFGLDYHPVYNPTRQNREWLLHYHCGNTADEVRKHRPCFGK